METEVETEVETEMETEVETEVETKMETKMETEVEMEMDESNYVNLPVNLPVIQAPDSDYDAEFVSSGLINTMMSLAVDYDARAIERKKYLFVSAKDVIVIHNRTPRSFRDLLLDEFRANHVIVQGMNLSSLQTENLNKTKFKIPWYFIKTQPLEKSNIYIYVDASVANGYAGWSFLIVHDGSVRKNGISSGPTPGGKSNSHWAELKAINLGLRAAILYINNMNDIDKKKIGAVIVRCDSLSAVSQCIGSSLIRKKVQEVEQALWDILSVRGSVEAIRFEYIDRELNEAADLLAKHACGLHQEPEAALDVARYTELCTSLINRNGKLCFKVQARSSK